MLKVTGTEFVSGISGGNIHEFKSYLYIPVRQKRHCLLNVTNYDGTIQIKLK